MYKEKIKEIREKGSYIQDARNIISHALHGVQNEDSKIGMTVKKINFNDPIIEENLEQLDIVHKLSHVDKLKVKQRMINFSMNIYERFDLKKIIGFWKSNNIFYFKI